MSNKVILRNFRAVIALLSCFTFQLSLNQVDPSYAKHFWKEFTILPEQQSFIFLAPYMICIIFSPLFARGVLLCKVDRRQVFILILMLNAILNLLIGPSKLLGFPDLFSLSISGYILQGILYNACLVLTLPEILRAVHLATGVNVNDSDLLLYSTQLIRLFCTLGAILGPLMNGLLVRFSSDGFSTSCDLCSLLFFVHFILYLVHSIFSTHDEAGDQTDLMTTNVTSPMVSLRFNKELTASTLGNDQLFGEGGQRVMSVDVKKSKLTNNMNQSMLFDSQNNEERIDFPEQNGRFQSVDIANLKQM